ncbi:MAG TPA: ROK family protein, partial [Solirubrobacteraceae bacterium]|nr:ROK family protein [Solirubrobacteraceae bacterium]
MTFVGIDVGGTKIAAATLDGAKLSESRLVHTEREDQARLIGQIATAIEEQLTDQTQAVGIGVPSVVDFASGRIRDSANIPLQDVPLRDLLADRTGLPVYIDNDASCAALAEAFEEGELTSPELVMFTIGTGVGGGTVLGGRVYRGATGAAPEMGHTIIGLDLSDGAPQEPGDFPQPGSLEALASGRALDRLALEAARADPGCFLGQRLARDGEVTGHDCVDGAKAGDEPSRHALRILGERLGIGIANAINLYDPLEVVIGGGVSNAGELLLEPARRVASRHVLPGVGTRTKIRLARHGPRAGVLGAALMAVQEWELDRKEGT